MARTPFGGQFAPGTPSVTAILRPNADARAECGNFFVMPYEVFIPDGCDYVEVKWLDEANATEIRSSGVDGLKLAAGQNISKVLVDISGIRNRLSTTDLFVETVEHSRLGPPHPRAALVGRTDQEEDLTFVATVGSNRGMSIRAFTSLQDAKDWLAT